MLHVESFMLDMINFASGVTRISIKCSYLKIFDQQGNQNFTFQWSDSFIIRVKFRLHV